MCSLIINGEDRRRERRCRIPGPLQKTWILQELLSQRGTGPTSLPSSLSWAYGGRRGWGGDADPMLQALPSGGGPKDPQPFTPRG